jgi:hypothetical protein
MIIKKLTPKNTEDQYNIAIYYLNSFWIFTLINIHKVFADEILGLSFLDIDPKLLFVSIVFYIMTYPIMAYWYR